MKYPPFLKLNGTIGLFAGSFGANTDPYKKRLESAIIKLQSLGFHFVIEGDIFGYYQGASAPKEARAAAFTNLYKNPNIDFLWSVGGGEWLMEILPFIDFDDLKNYPPKYVMGYSDNTHLTLLMNTLLDTASLYGQHIPEFGRTHWDDSLIQAIEIITGVRNYQENFKLFEAKNVLQANPLDGYVLTETTKWIHLSNETEIRMSGRFIGGCLDILLSHLGTQYDCIHQFINQYQDDGIIWFIEACDLNLFGLKRALWQLKEAGWFTYTKGIIFGRHLNATPIIDLDPYQTTKDLLSDLKIPLIMDADFGHIAPTFTLISGSYVEIESKNGLGSIKTFLR
jgi:muramoyltetrapeptide carboxypeptidase LdcA involved in peptidoglycan recycling